MEESLTWAGIACTAPFAAGLLGALAGVLPARWTWWTSLFLPAGLCLQAAARASTTPGLTVVTCPAALAMAGALVLWVRPRVRRVPPGHMRAFRRHLADSRARPPRRPGGAR